MKDHAPFQGEISIRRFKGQCKGHKVKKVGIPTRNTHTKDERSTSFGEKEMTKVKKGLCYKQTDK